MRSKRNVALCLLFSCFLSLRYGIAQAPEYMSFSSAQPVLTAMHDSLPTALKTSGPITANAWNEWIRSRDKEIRSRLKGGEEDTLTNLLRLGVTYTKQPRISFADLMSYGYSSVTSIADKRANDLVRALAAPHVNQGTLEMRAFLQNQGLDLTKPEGQKKAKAYMLANLVRQRDEVVKWVAEVSGKNVNPDQAYKARGISTDSDLYPDYLLELHLRHMMEKGMLKAGSVHRVAVIGPGLDFVNKNDGADFYPPQTTQPFAVIDSLARLGLADPASVQLYTFDISPRVNRHIERALKNAAVGKPYSIQLLCNPQDQWEAAYRAGFLDYWQKFGSQIGTPIAPIAVPSAASDLKNRAVRIRPNVVGRITPVEMNVVFQTLPLPPAQQFDLVIGTNIFIYYGALEQSLAQVNLGTMIKPGGFLLTTEVLPNTPSSRLANSLQTSVLLKVDDSEHMYSYIRQE